MTISSYAEEPSFIEPEGNVEPEVNVKPEVNDDCSRTCIVIWLSTLI